MSTHTDINVTMMREFIQSIDMIIVTLLAAIAALWATVRKADDYEVSLAVKHN